MSNRRRFASPLKLACFALIAGATVLGTKDDVAAISSDQNVGELAAISEHLNEQVDLSLVFTNSDGVSAPLRSFIESGKPAILTPIYYACPSLCSFTLNGLVAALNGIDERIGLDYTVISYSIHPDEKPELAREKAANYYQELKNPLDGERGWYFLTASESVSKTLSDQIGFTYERDGNDYTHAAVFVVLTPDGRISRYFYGIQPKPRDVRFALVEASEGKFGTAFDQILLYCFRWDHLTGRYSFVAWNSVRDTSIAVVLVLFGYLIRLRMKELKGCEKLS